jgi:hypothetical protein
MLSVPFVYLDYDDESLDGNLLQLSSPSVLVLDETSLVAGTLNSQGISNLRALSKLLSQSSLEYDFQYQSLDFPVEYASLLLSQGSKSLLAQDGQHAIDISIKLQFPSQVHDIIQSPTSEQLNFWRAYLLLSRVNEFSIAESFSSQVESKYLLLRQQRPKATNEQILHLLLNLARLLCLSYGENTLNESRWEEVTSLFEQIYQRGISA